jgi:hypothetical protein
VRDTVAVETRASRATSASLAVLVDEVRFMKPGAPALPALLLPEGQITSTSAARARCPDPDIRATDGR